MVVLRRMMMDGSVIFSLLEFFVVVVFLFLVILGVLKV